MLNDDTWQRLAYLYKHKQIKLIEIAQGAILFSLCGMFGEIEIIRKAGLNPLYESDITQALTHCLIYHLTTAKPIKSGDLSNITGLHKQTLQKYINNLIDERKITRDDLGCLGSEFAIKEPLKYHKWIEALSLALIDLHEQESLTISIENELGHIDISAIYTQCKNELKSLYYRPSTKDQ